MYAFKERSVVDKSFKGSNLVSCKVLTCLRSLIITMRVYFYLSQLVKEEFCTIHDKCISNNQSILFFTEFEPDCKDLL